MIMDQNELFFIVVSKKKRIESVGFGEKGLSRPYCFQRQGSGFDGAFGETPWKSSAVAKSLGCIGCENVPPMSN